MSVLLETSMGDLVIDLYYEQCPLASKNFIKLCKQKFYNGALFNNMQKNYLVQIRSLQPPTCIYNTPTFKDQFHASLKHNRLGVVSTANKGPDQNNSDFFILLTNHNLPQLNQKHSVFGQVQEGLEMLVKLNDIHVDDNNRPLLNVRIRHSIILHDPFEDPIQMVFPSRSPSPHYKAEGRLEYEEKEHFIDRYDNQTQEELIELAKDHKARTNAISLEILGDIPDAEAKPPENILFVCKLNPITEEKDLEIIFSKFGPIKSCDIVRDWKTGTSLQYAFVEFESITSCEEAYLKMENALIDDRRIHVDFCQSAAKQWAQLKRAQRRKRELKQQREMIKQTKDKEQSLIDQLQIKKDFYNQRQNYNYIPDRQQEMENEAQAEQIVQEIQKQQEKIGRKLQKKQASQSRSRSKGRGKKSSNSSSSSSSRGRSSSKKKQHKRKDNKRRNSSTSESHSHPSQKQTKRDKRQRKSHHYKK